MSRWTTRVFVLAGMFAAVMFALAFALGAGIITATGIPATGGIANIFVAVFILMIAVRLVPVFGFATLTLTLLFTLAVPTVIGGPPGPQKILSGLAVGLCIDIVLAAGGRSFTAHVVAGSVGAAVSILSIYGLLLVMRLPGADRLAPLVAPLTVVQAVLGGTAAWLGCRLFDSRLEKLSAVRRLVATTTPVDR